MKLKLLSAIQEVDAAQWNRLVSNGYPFLQHAFIDSMEKNQCVGEDHGWIPRHLTCFDDQDNLLGALPLFEKHNSWGEFVFDYAWADAFHRAGLQYYPKLVNAIPFTPATGQRILLDAANRTAIKDALIKGTMSLVGQGEFSGLHSLFLNPDEYLLLKDDVTVTRVDCQFHWHNQNFSSFEDFLDTLKSKKRKNIRQERRKVKQSGVTIECLDGHSASETDWAEFTRLYRSIYNRKYGQPAFNAGFFKDVARSLAEQVLLVVARFDGRVIAASLMYHDAETLYGRHWGCDGYVDSLHFELCYYQGIEYCIRHSLKRFDPGAQGEHKIARGFLPTKTRSLHWMGSLQFRDAVKRFVDQEQRSVNYYIEAVDQHNPYLSSATAP